MANTKVTTGVIKDDAVGADQLASNSVVTASIVDNAITTAKINNDAILTAKISDNAVTNAKLSSNSVDSDQYVDASIDTAHIRDGQITSAKLDTNISVSGELTVGSHLNMGDGDILKMGASADLQIYHDGTNSYVKENGDGALVLQSAGPAIVLEKTDGTNMVLANTDGAVTLYYAGSEKLATTSSGVDVTGTATMDGLTVNSSEVLFDNTGGDFTLKLNTNAVSDKNEIIMGDSGTPLAKFGVGGTANDIITGSDGQDFNIATAGGGRAINFSTDNFASVEMKLDGGKLGIGTNPYHTFDVFGAVIANGAAKSNGLFFDTTSATTGTGGGIALGGYSNGTGGAIYHFGNIQGIKENSTAGNYASAMLFSTRANGATPTERMRINSSGNVGIGNSSCLQKLHISNGTILIGSDSNTTQTNNLLNGYGYRIGSTLYGSVGIRSSYNNGNNQASLDFYTEDTERMRIDSSGNLLVGVTSRTGGKIFGQATPSVPFIETQNSSTGATHYAMFFRNSGGTEIGFIKISNTGTTYDTGSDYRLKENAEPIQNGLERLNQLNPVKFDWKADGTSSEGFIAHEVQEIFPDAVSGEKDAETMQGMDYGRITPLLVKAIQEQQTQIETLKAEIQELKG